MATNVERFAMDYERDPQMTNATDKMQIAEFRDQLDVLRAKHDELSIKRASVVSMLERVEGGELDPIVAEEKATFVTQLTAKADELATTIDGVLSSINTVSDNIVKLEIGLMIKEY